MPKPSNTHWLTASWCFRDHPKEDKPPLPSFWGLGSRETMLELLHKGRGKSWYWFRKRASARLKGWMISPRLGRILEFPGMETCPWLVCSRGVCVCERESERERERERESCLTGCLCLHQRSSLTPTPAHPACRLWSCTLSVVPQESWNSSIKTEKKVLLQLFPPNVGTSQT